MSDTTPKDQPPKPLQFPEPVQVQARTRTRRKKPGKARNNVIQFQPIVENPELLLEETLILIEMVGERVRAIHRQAHHREGDEQ